MNCDVCNGTGWKVIERGGTSGVERCECRKRAAESENQTPITVQNGAALTKILLDQFSFAPQSPAARSAIAMDLMKMCGTVEALEFLVQTSRKLYEKWPGLPALRQVLTHRYRAQDGISFGGFSSAYPDGIGEALTGVPETPTLRIEGSSDREMDAWVRTLGEVKRIEAIPDRTRGPRQKPVLPPLAHPVTAEDVERASAEYRAKRAQKAPDEHGE